MTKLERPRQRTDRRTNGQAQNNKDNVLFASLLIGLSVDFFAMVARAHACGVVCACMCACVRVCVRLCLIVKML